MMTWEETMGWGSGSTFQTAASTGLMRYGLGDDEYALLRNILLASTQALRKTHTFDLEEYVGGQGPQGIPGPRGLPGLPGTGTSFVPTEQIVSESAPPARRVYHDSEVGTVDFTSIGVVYAQIATADIYSGSDVDATGWAQIENGGAGSRTVTLWMQYRAVGDSAPDGTQVGDSTVTVIPAGESRTARTRAAFSISTPGSVVRYYLDLYAKIDTLEPLLLLPANHYGITGRGVFQRS
jgi:hypothetical protein